jgi:Tol biopolymer transport system component
MPASIVSASSAGDAGNSGVVRNGSNSNTANVQSADGRYVVFASSASNLASGDYNGNSASDIFLRDTLTGTTTLITAGANGASVSPSI